MSTIMKGLGEAGAVIIAKAAAGATYKECGQAGLDTLVRQRLAADPLEPRVQALSAVMKTGAGTFFWNMIRSPFAGEPFGDAIRKTEALAPGSMLEELDRVESIMKSEALAHRSKK